MVRRQPRSTRTYNLVPYTKLFRSQRILDFGGIDIHATAQDQIGASIGNVEIPLLVQPPAIAAGLVAVVRAMRLRAKEAIRSEEHTSELQSLMRISYAVFCLQKTNP